jgi:flagellar hook-associated protein 1 FlgK
MGMNSGATYGTFGVLNTAYSGLQVSQLAIGVVSHNISNANNDNYTRQRVTIQARAPINANNGDLGTGAMVYNVQRVQDQFLFNKYTAASQTKEFTSFENDTLQEVSTYFPDIQGNGLANDLQNYYAAWQSYANSPADTSQAIALAQKSDVLATNINDTVGRLKDLQSTLNDQMTPIVNEINQLGTQIASLNGAITAHEANGQSVANDLRDQRDADILSLKKLVNVDVSTSMPQSNASIDPNLYDKTQNYVIEVGGRPLVDGSGFHPLVIQQDPNSSSEKFDTVYFQYQDYSVEDITSKLQGGKLGAILDLRGSNVDKTSEPTTGKLQSYIDTLNSFASGLIESTNNIYASSAKGYMQSNTINTTGNEPLSYMPTNIHSGTFNAIVYDANGNQVASKAISINIDTDTMATIAAKFNTASDDNGDGNATNDFSNYFNAQLTTGTNGSFQISGNSTAIAKGYTFAIQDSTNSPTNFAGAIGLSRFFDGSKATNIKLNQDLIQDPTTIKAYGAPVVGNNDMANQMLQLQYDQVDFKQRDGSHNQNTISGYYNNLNALVSTDTSTAVSANDSATALFNNIQTQYNAVTKVSLDEELTNLIKFQSGYGASAKCVTTIDQMIQTLLGIKQ